MTHVSRKENDPSNKRRRTTTVLNSFILRQSIKQSRGVVVRMRREIEGMGKHEKNEAYPSSNDEGQ